jgi:enoyl-CoA hydratase
MSPSDDLLLIDRPMPGVARLLLNRPSVRNALSLALRSRLAAALRSLAEASDVQVLVLSGVGPAFCAGLDLHELRDPASGALSQLPVHDPVAALVDFPGVTIGAINGAAITGGFELALGCDILIAADSAFFADTHVRVGVVPGWGLSQRLSRVIGPVRAKAVSLAARPIDAVQAAAWGLVWRHLPDAQLMPEALALAADITAAAQGMVPVYKHLIDEGLRRSLPEGLALEAKAMRDWSTRHAPIGTRP